MRIFSYFVQNDWCLSYALMLLRGSGHRFYERVKHAFVEVSEQRLRARHDGAIYEQDTLAATERLKSHFVILSFCHFSFHVHTRIINIYNKNIINI